MAALRRIGAYEFSPAALGIARFTTKVPVSQVMAMDPSIIMAGAAPMYANTASRSCGGGIVPCTLLYDAARGVNFPSKFVSSGATFSVVNGRVIVKPGAVIAPGATVAVQGYPTIAWNGAAAGPSTGESSVAGLGLLRNGNLLYMVAAAGSPRALGAEFVRRGAIAAVYMDAGASASLFLREGGWQGVHAGGATGPKIPGWIIATGGAAEPSLFDANGNVFGSLSTATKIGIILVGLGLMGATAWWLLREPAPVMAQAY